MAGLSRVDTVLAEIDPKQSYDVGHIAAAVFDQHGNVTLVIYLLGFSAPLLGEDITRMGQQLARVGTSTTRASAGVVPARRHVPQLMFRAERRRSRPNKHRVRVLPRNEATEIHRRRLRALG